MLTKASTGGALGAAGDLAAQLGTKDQVDMYRLWGFTAFGLLYVGSFNYFWFGWLARRFPVCTFAFPALYVHCVA
jgi:hypothetical protein